MDEFVSKKLLVAKFNELASKYTDGDKRQRGLAYATAADIIAFTDAADVQSVKRGKWEKKRGYLVCSNCGMAVDTIGYTYEEQEEVFRYCSCCGYRMDGDTNG